MGLHHIPSVRHRLTPNSQDSESRRAIEHAAGVIEEEMPRKWTSYVWDTLDKPKEERWFMFKLDAALLTFASLG